MAVKLTCPRCNTALQVPAKLLGQYTQCPACQNRILIPPQLPPTVAGGPAASGPAGFSAVPAQPAPDAAERPGHLLPAAVWSEHASAEPAPQRKVARFITAESAPSTVQLAPNGELPKLQLAEGPHSSKPGSTGPGMNPLVLVGAACLSFCMCVVLLLYDFGDTGVDSHQEAEVRKLIESYYKSQEGPLEPYQVHLREAQQARSRGDRQAEQQHYRKVLDLLHAERDPRDRFRGLTGTTQSDQTLEKQLAKLLAGQHSEAPDESN